MKNRFPLLALPLVMACTQWSRYSTAQLTEAGQRTRVQVWTSESVFDLHDVRLRGDSLVAVQHWQPIDCESCPLVVLALADIDSVRQRTSAGTRTSALGIGIGTTLVAFLIAMSQANLD